MLSVFIPPTLSEIIIPGIGTQASFLVWILMILIMGIFLIRVLSDALILGDILTDVALVDLPYIAQGNPLLLRIERDVTVAGNAVAAIGILIQQFFDDFLLADGLL